MVHGKESGQWGSTLQPSLPLLHILYLLLL